MLPGVYQAKKKDNTIYFRSSITYSGKHISLGSFDTEEKAHEAYLYAGRLLAGKEITLTSYKKENPVLSFSKWVSLINFRDNGIYIKTPIYYLTLPIIPLGMLPGGVPDGSFPN